VLAYYAGPALAVPEIDQPAPALKGRLFSGAPFDLAQMHGKVVLVNFYSSYCSFCAYEIGLLEALYERYRADGLEVIAVGVDAPEDRPRVERMLGIYNLPERWQTSWRRMALRGVIPRPPHSSSIAKGYYAIASSARSDRTTTKSWSYPS
jgi:thiol-disulfide isomerase/thioredoxin